MAVSTSPADSDLCVPEKYALLVSNPLDVSEWVQIIRPGLLAATLNSTCQTDADLSRFAHEIPLKWQALQLCKSHWTELLDQGDIKAVSCSLS